MARAGVLRAGDVRLRLALAAVLLAGCSTGTSAYESCVQHSVEEGVDRAAAEAACADVTEE